MVFATVAAAHTCRRVITLAGVACGERWPKATGETRSLLASQVALDLRVRRPSVMSLPLGVARRPVSIKNPTGNNHRRHHMRRIATSALQPQPTQSQHDRCCGWQIRFESGGNSGGEIRARERSRPIQQGAPSKCSSWCAPLLSELCGLPSRLFAVFATVATDHTSSSAITSAGAACGEHWPKAIGATG